MPRLVWERGRDGVAVEQRAKVGDRHPQQRVEGLTVAKSVPFSIAAQEHGTADPS
jgi:hypothetical protein